MGARVVSVWHWLPGDAPQRTPAAAYRVGRAVGLLGDTLLALGRAGLPEGRFARLARAAESDRAWLSELALRDPVAADTLALYLPPTPIGGWGRAPCHTDVFGANLVDDGAQVGVLDFDELGLDDPSVDRLAYLAWEVFSPEDGFRADLCAAYLQGLRSVDATPPPADAIAWLVFLNVAENVFNLALRRARPRHVYPLYAANLQRARLVLEQREALCRALSESNTPPPEGA
jgi:aminoglycoside phosphotransferase (APT) family kinase protein